MEAIVYITTNKVNGKKYIGSHAGDNKYYYGSGVNLKKAMKKHGTKNFIRQTLWEGPLEYMREMEEYYIDYYSAYESPLFYNANRKGVGRIFGDKLNMTDEAKAIRNVKIGNTNRRPKPKGFGAIISEIKKGKSCNMSAEAKAIRNAKISKALKGKTRSEEVKAKMSKALKGKPNPKNNKPILQFDLQGNFIREWISATEASRMINARQGDISTVANNKQKTAFGFIWKFKNI